MSQSTFNGVENGKIYIDFRILIMYDVFDHSSGIGII